MPEPGYLATALGVAVLITVALRAAPFFLRRAMAGSALLADVGRWMPLGAVAILAAYCLAGIDVGDRPYGLPEISGAAATVAVHWWRRNAVVSIVTGTAVCLALTNVLS